MVAVLLLLFAHFSMTGSLDIESYLDFWCGEPMKIIDFHELRFYDDFKKEAQFRCGIELKHIPNQLLGSNLTDQFLQTTTSRLKVLKISDEVNQIDKEFFGLDLRLAVLDLSGNHLHYLEFSENNTILRFLETLDLSQNNFSNFSFIIYNVPFLSDLDLSQNNFENMALIPLQYFPNLNNLIIRKNNIVKFEQVKITSLEYLDVSYNNLTDLNGLKMFINLRFLYLDHNFLPKLSATSFEVEMWGLEELSLDYNRIEEVVSNAFRNTPNLQILKLNHNKIKKLDSDIFYNLRRLTFVDISNNFLTELDAILSFSQKNLFQLNFRNNRIEKIDYVLMSQRLPSLKEIDLMKNQFSCDYFRNMFSFFKEKNIYLIGEEQCTFHESFNNSFCCKESTLNNASTIVYDNADPKSKKNTSEIIYSLQGAPITTSQSISDYISSMEEKSEAFFKLLLYQFGFIVFMFVVYIIICIFRYCGTKKTDVINKEVKIV